MLAALCVTYLITGSMICSVPIRADFAEAIASNPPQSFVLGGHMTTLNERMSPVFVVREGDPQWQDAVRLGSPATPS